MDRTLTDSRFQQISDLTKLGIAALGILSGLTGCEISEEAQQDLLAALSRPPSGDYSGVPGGGPTPQCFGERYMQADAAVTRKLDLLFVIDTSGSLSDERSAVSAGIDAFVGQLPADVDFRISVMLAHGDTSAYHGRLYSASGRPKVLDSQARTLTQIRSDLRANLTQIRTDAGTDGGEAMLYSLTQGLQGQLLADSQALGFFRADAALAVVLLSDEQDICAEFPEGVTPVPDAQNSEVPAKARICAGITPESVHALVKKVKNGMPYLFSSIIYSNPETYVASGENEIGYGLLELTRNTGGVLIDIASGEYSQGLSEAGRLATVKLDLLADFTLARREIDPASLRVWVDGLVAGFAYSANTNEVHVNDPGIARSVVDIHYCLQPQSVPPTQPAPCIGLGCGGGALGI